jgi:hypothetical protein
MLFTFVACEKQYKKSQNKNVEIVQELNSGNFTEVIANLEGRTNLTSREKYYLASSYSRNGGVDVFSLYSILEIQLFHKNALEWSDLSKDKNPYLKFMRTQEGVDKKARKVKREKKWEENLPEIMRRHSYYPLMTYEEMSSRGVQSSITKEEFDEIHTYLKEKYLEIKNMDISLKDKDEKIFNIVCIYPVTDVSHNAKNSVCTNLKFQYFDVLYLDDLKDRYVNPEKRTDANFSDAEWEMTLMNVLWNTYEAIPLIRKLPTLTLEQQGEITKSLDLYSELTTSSKFKDVSLKNVAILSGVSLLSIYKESFDLEGVNSIHDLYCDFNPITLMEYYPLIRKRLIFLSEVASKVDYQDSGYQTYKEKIQNLKEKLPETLSEFQKRHYQESVKDFQLSKCFNG